MNCVECVDPDKDKVIADIERKGVLGKPQSSFTYEAKEVMFERIDSGLCAICGNSIHIGNIVMAPSGYDSLIGTIKICEHHHRCVK